MKRMINFSETETLSEIDNINRQKNIESKNSKYAIIISGLILLALIGGLTGMLVASSQPAPVVANASIQSAEEWIGNAQIDAGKTDQIETIHNQNSQLDAEEQISEIDSIVYSENKIIKTGEVKSGIPVIKNLTSLGLSMGDAQLIINALDGIFDFRRARPGHKFELRIDKETHKPVYFKYQASLTDVYVVKKRGDLYKGRKTIIKTKKSIVVLGGTITKSLYGTLSDLGAKPALAGKIADVLSTQVNFYKEQRPGDTFRVMIEAESLKDKFLGYGPVLALEYNGVKSGKKRFFRFEKTKDNSTYYSAKGVSVPRSIIAIPLHYTRLSSPFGYRLHPVLKRKKLHNGTDFAAPTGTPVWACADGTVTIASKKGANGNLVAITHSEGLQSFYAHLFRFGTGIKKGKKVKQRQLIGYVGSTGRSTGPHLHWGLKKNGKFVDPLKYKIRPGTRIAAKYRSRLNTVIKNRSVRLDNCKIQRPKEKLAIVPDHKNEVLGSEEDF